MAAGLGFKTFTTGEVLTAADVNGYLMQGVLVFASEAARNSAITSPQEGQFAYTKDNNSLWYYTGSAWVASGATGDIEGVTAGTGISGGGTSGTVTITNSMATEITAKADLIVGTGNAAFDNLAVGANGTVLTADSTVSPTGLKWAAPAGGGGGLVFIGNTTFTSSSTINVNDVFSTTYDNYRILIVGASVGGSAAQLSFRLRVSSTDTITNYQGLRIYADSTVGTDNNVVGTDEIFFGSLGTSANTKSLQVYDIAAPYLTSDTSIAGTSGRTGAAYQMNINYGVQTSSTSFTGFTILSSENATGTIAVYGYAKA